MRSQRVEDISEFVLDGTHGSPVRTATGIPVLSAQNIKDGSLSFETDRYTSDQEHRAFCSRLALQPGDLLLTIVGTIGRAAVMTELRPLVFQRSVAVIRPRRSIIDSRFLFHATQAPGFQAQLTKAVNQSSQAGVYLGRLRQLIVPLPVLREQQKIADVLDRAEMLRVKRRAALVQLDTLAQAAFLELFGDPVANPKGWERKPVAEIGKVITGNTPSRANPDYFGAAIEWIKSDNIAPHNYYVTRAEEGLSEAGKAIARTAPAHSILVTCIAGSPESIGNAAMTDREVAFNQQINALVPYGGNADFLYAQIRFGKPLIQAASTAAMKGMVSKSRFEAIPLIFPPIDLQRLFARRIAAVERLKAAHRAALLELDEFFASLQHRAFRGEL